jgi:hypothetical protein
VGAMQRQQHTEDCSYQGPTICSLRKEYVYSFIRLSRVIHIACAAAVKEVRVGSFYIMNKMIHKIENCLSLLRHYVQYCSYIPQNLFFS